MSDPELGSYVQRSIHISTNVPYARADLDAPALLGSAISPPMYSPWYTRMSVTTANFWSVVKPLVYPMAVTPWKLVMPWGSAFIGSNGGFWLGGPGKNWLKRP